MVGGEAEQEHKEGGKGSGEGIGKALGVIYIVSTMEIPWRT